MIKKILVTGGAGYIGSHTIVELLNAGYEPVIVDNLCNSSQHNLIGIEKITGVKVKWHKIDCTNKNSMAKVFKEDEEIKGIIHFAAFKSVEESVKYPKKYYDNNIRSLEVVLKFMQEYNIKNIIFSSSCTVYGSPDTLPVNENSPFKKAESPYAETKQICEKIITKHDCNSIALRYFNPIGSHKSNLIGDCSADKPSNLVPIITETAIGKREKTIVFGNNYNTHDGTCIRDYIHVVDLAKSHVEAVDYIIKNSGKYAFNIGTGIGTSVLDIIKTFEKSNNLKLKYSIGGRRSGDIEKIYANNSLAKKELSWQAKESLEDALKSAWNWEKNKKNNV